MTESVMHQEMEKWLRAQTTCVAAGITLHRENYSFKRATPTIYRDNLRGFVTVDDLKIPHSELAIHQGAAGKDILALSLTGTQTGMAIYDKGDGICEYISGLENEIFSHALIEQVNKMWRKVGPGGEPEERYAPPAIKFPETQKRWESLGVKIKLEHYHKYDEDLDFDSEVFDKIHAIEYNMPGSEDAKRWLMAKAGELDIKEY